MQVALIEKPVAYSPEDLAFFSDLPREVSKSIKVMANMRFHAGPATLAEHIGLVGVPRIASANFGSFLPDMRPGVDYRTVYAAHRDKGGGVVMDCIHELDYLSWLFGVPTLVSGQLARLSELEIDTEDHAVGLFDHPQGVRSLVELDYLQRHKMRGCRVVGTEGTLVWQSRFKAPETIDVAFYSAEERVPRIVFPAGDYDIDQSYRSYLRAFLGVGVSGDSDRLLGLETAIQEVSLSRELIGHWESGPSSEPPVPAAESNAFSESERLFDRASKVIPTASQTFSKSRIQFPGGITPDFLSHGRGGRVWDVDGNSYVDLVMGLCCNILG